MKKILFVVILGTLLLIGCASNNSHTTGNSIEASNVWARSAMKGGNGAAYMLLKNNTNEDEPLVGVSSDVAEATEIHLSQIKADGTMEMTPQESIPLPARGKVEFKPGSYHVMLIGLKRDLKAGDEISLTLHFKNHEDLTLNVPVRDAENMGGSGMDGHMP
jgi:copper(I)-binding protein